MYKRAHKHHSTVLFLAWLHSQGLERNSGKQNLIDGKLPSVQLSLLTGRQASHTLKALVYTTCTAAQGKTLSKSVATVTWHRGIDYCMSHA